MLIVRDPAQLQDFSDPALQLFLQQRLAALGDPGSYQADRHGFLMLVEPGDTDALIARMTDFPLLQNWIDGSVFPDDDFIPSFDSIEDQEKWYELVVALNDDGFTLVVIVLKQPGIDPVIAAMCRQYAIPVSASSSLEVLSVLGVANAVL